MNVKNPQLRPNTRNFLIGLFMFCGIFVFANNLIAQNCKYDKKNGITGVGGHIQYDFQLGEISRIRGKVFDPVSETVPGALIILHRLEAKEKIFIGSQLSDAEGNFCFKGMKKGKYELQVGGVGFNASVYYFELDPKNKKLSSEIKAFLRMGT